MTAFWYEVTETTRVKMEDATVEKDVKIIKLARYAHTWHTPVISEWHLRELNAIFEHWRRALAFCTRQQQPTSLPLHGRRIIVIFHSPDGAACKRRVY